MDHLRVHNPVVSWNKIVWVPGGNPRHSFVLWLAAHTRLSTHDRIYKFTHGPLACVFCHSQMESHDHLFFACPYSSFIWQDLMIRCGLSWNGQCWKDTLQWMSQRLKGKKMHQIIPKMWLGATVYGLWKERNNRTFKLLFFSKEHLLKNLTSQVNALIRLKWKHQCILDSMLSKWS